MTLRFFRIFLFLFLILGWTTASFAQRVKNNDEIERHKSKVDFGLNVTSVLSSFSGNGSFLEPSDLPMLVRLNTKKSTIRLAVGARGSSNDFFDNITGAFRVSEEMAFFGKLGLEGTILSQKKIDGYIGIDYVGSYGLDKVTVESFDQSIIRKTSIGYGLSPFIGLKFYLTDRIYISSEANIFYQLTTEKTRERTGGNPEVTILDLTKEEFSINPPLFLYINYKL